MARNSLLDHVKSQLEVLPGELRGAIIDFTVPDEKVLQLRAEARRLLDDVKELERKTGKKGWFRLSRILTSIELFKVHHTRQRPHPANHEFRKISACLAVILE